MNPLVKKEIRLLLPSVAICCALGLANLFFQFDSNGSILNWWLIVPSFVFCGGIAVMLALNSFGAEISLGTFSNLLAQPIPRQKIWDTKILALAVSLLVVAVFWSACGIIRLAMLGRDLGLLDLFTTVGTFGLVVFSGGLWTVLLLRQIAAAFWFTVLLPGMILVTLTGLFADHSGMFIEGIVASVLGLYSLAGFFFARWLFFRAQDLQWMGGTLVLPEMRGLARLKSVASARRIWRPRAALWRKEIQLHQSQFVIAFVLLVLHLGVIVTRHVGHFRKNSTTEFILESFWALWLVMPALVGCAAVAEERRLGTHESQLCLPVKRRTQFTVKLLAVLGLSLFFGVFIPLLLEGTNILPAVQFDFSSVHNLKANAAGELSFGIILATFNHLLPLLSLVGGVVAAAGISFYVSTLGRNALQTLAPAVTGIALTFFFFSIATLPRPFEYNFGFLWRGPLPYFIVFPAMALTLLVLASGNYQHVLAGWKLGRRNLLTLVSVFLLGVAVTSAVYHRFWERFTPFEPPHGSARLALANPAKLSQEGGELSVRLPDGKIWMANFNLEPKTSRLAYLLGNIKWVLNNAQFISGTNWLTVKPTGPELVGIKTDGSLWVSEKPRQVIRQNGRLTINEDEMRRLVQFGNETNWNSLEPWANSVLLTKTDGTLWRWGPQYFNYDANTNRWPGLRAFTPERLGTESNWAEVSHIPYGFVLHKTDGSVWRSWQWPTNGLNLLEVRPDFWLVSVPHNEPRPFQPTVEIYNGLPSRLVVQDNGTFRIWEQMVPVYNPKFKSNSFVWSNTDLQIGNGTNWLAVAGVGNKAITLKNDGTLWLWRFGRDNRWNWDQDRSEREILNTVPVQLGTHSDWIAISSVDGLVATLSADGGLWLWPVGESYETIYDEDNHPIPRLLDISRKPQLLGNIFGSVASKR